MGKNYAAFIGGLPEIVRDERKLPLGIHNFREEAKEYITGKDADLLNLIFLPNDNAQVLRLLRKMEPDPELQTVFSIQQLEDSIADPVRLPAYLGAFITDFREDTLKPDMSLENVMSWMYYDYMIHSDNRIMHAYGEFSMNLRNLIAALNCRKYNRDISKEVIGENEFAVALRTVNAKDFGLSVDYSYVERVIALMENKNLVERERGLDFLMWDFLEEEVTFEYFSIEKVIVFALELLIVNRWSNMSSESGRKVFMEVVERFRKNLVIDDL